MNCGAYNKINDSQAKSIRKLSDYQIMTKGRRTDISILSQDYDVWGESTDTLLHTKNTFAIINFPPGEMPLIRIRQPGTCGTLNIPFTYSIENEKLIVEGRTLPDYKFLPNGKLIANESFLPSGFTNWRLKAGQLLADAVQTKASEPNTTTGVFFYDILPTEAYFRWEDSVENGDVFYFFSIDERGNKMPVIFKTVNQMGNFSSQLIWRKFMCAPITSLTEVPAAVAVQILKVCQGTAEATTGDDDGE